MTKRVARIYSLNAEDFENQDTLLLILYITAFSSLQSSHHIPSILRVSLMESPHSWADGLVSLSNQLWSHKEQLCYFFCYCKIHRFWFCSVVGSDVPPGLKQNRNTSDSNICREKFLLIHFLSWYHCLMDYFFSTFKKWWLMLTKRAVFVVSVSWFRLG